MEAWRSNCERNGTTSLPSLKPSSWPSEKKEKERFGEEGSLGRRWRTEEEVAKVTLTPP